MAKSELSEYEDAKGEFASKTSEEKFAHERSHKASELGYDLGKATGQACLLINGGAATAVIALLAKDKTEPILFRFVPWGLGLYALGVVASAILLFSVMMRAENWNYYWYRVYFTGEHKLGNLAEERAKSWETRVFVAFVFAIGFFGAGSLLVALAMGLANG